MCLYTRTYVVISKARFNLLQLLAVYVHQLESDMNQYYTTTYTVDNSPEEVFATINNVRGWWSEEIEGSTDKLGAQFYYHYGDVHRCTLKISEFVPNQK